MPETIVYDGEGLRRPIAGLSQLRDLVGGYVGEFESAVIAAGNPAPNIADPLSAQIKTSTDGHVGIMLTILHGLGLALESTEQKTLGAAKVHETIEGAATSVSGSWSGGGHR